MSATKTLAQFIVDTSYETLPASVVDAAKVAILDGVANMLGGSTQELAAIIGQYVKALGGTPQSTVIGWGFKTNPPAAAPTPEHGWFAPDEITALPLAASARKTLENLLDTPLRST